MTHYTVKLKIYKYSVLKWEEDYTLTANTRAEAKRKAKDRANSTQWAADLSVIPDLRTLKLCK